MTITETIMTSTNIHSDVARRIIEKYPSLRHLDENTRVQSINDLIRCQRIVMECVAEYTTLKNEGKCNEADIYNMEEVTLSCLKGHISHAQMADDNLDWFFKCMTEVIKSTIKVQKRLNSIKNRIAHDEECENIAVGLFF